MAKRKLRDKILVPVRIDRELVKELDIIALKTNRYRSEIIREAITEAVKRYHFLENQKPRAV